MTEPEKIAQQKYENGEKWNCSIFIDEDTIIAGYGKLDLDFEFPLPTSTIIKLYGTNSWKKRMNQFINKE